MKTALDILKDARQLISKEYNWCKYDMAKMPSGPSITCLDYIGCFETHPDACKWCSIGAIKKSCEQTMSVIDTQWDEYLSARYAIEDIVVALGYEDISEWNDHPTTTHQNVMNVFDDGIQQLTP